MEIWLRRASSWLQSSQSREGTMWSWAHKHSTLSVLHVLIVSGQDLFKLFKWSGILWKIFPEIEVFESLQFVGGEEGTIGFVVRSLTGQLGNHSGELPLLITPGGRETNHFKMHLITMYDILPFKNMLCTNSPLTYYLIMSSDILWEQKNIFLMLAFQCEQFGKFTALTCVWLTFHRESGRWG